MKRAYIAGCGGMLGAAFFDVQTLMRQISDGKRKLFIVNDELGTPTFRSGLPAQRKSAAGHEAAGAL